MELVFVLLQKRQSCSQNQATHAVANERETTELTSWTTFTNILVDFFCDAFSHVEDVLVRVSFVGLAAKEQGVWQSY